MEGIEGEQQRKDAEMLNSRESSTKAGFLLLSANAEICQCNC